MQMSDGLLRVFWPYDLPRSSAPGVIVGWRNSELDLFVLAVLEDVEVREPLYGSGGLSMLIVVRRDLYSLGMLIMPSARGSSSEIALTLFRAFLDSVGGHRCMC
jgi:hypothetical protein